MSPAESRAFEALAEAQRLCKRARITLAGTAITRAGEVHSLAALPKPALLAHSEFGDSYRCLIPGVGVVRWLAGHTEAVAPGGRRFRLDRETHEVTEVAAHAGA